MSATQITSHLENKLTTMEGAPSAIARERQLKRWSHKKKEALIRGDRAALRYASYFGF